MTWNCLLYVWFDQCPWFVVFRCFAECYFLSLKTWCPIWFFSCFFEGLGSSKFFSEDMSLFIFLCYRVVPLLNVIWHDVEYFFVKGRLFISKLEFQCFFPLFFVVVMDLLDWCWTFEKLSFSRKQHYEPTIQISWHLSKSVNSKLIDLIGSILQAKIPIFW
jgi:hypothetical protein